MQGSSLVSAVLYSVGPAILAISFDTILGLPLGFFLCTSHARYKRLLAILVRLPLGVPPLVAGVMLLVAFGPYSPIGKIFHGQLTNSFAAIFIAQAFTALPFVVEGARGAFGSIDLEAQVVADSLLMGPVRRLNQIYIPLAWSSIRSSITLGFLRAFGEFGAVLLVAYSPASLPIYTYISFEGAGLEATLAPIVITLIVTGVVAALLASMPWPQKVISALVGARIFKARLIYQGQIKLESTKPRVSCVTVYGKVGTFDLDVSFEVYRGCTVLLGPSGSGKTLTLHAIAHHIADGLSASIEGELASACESPIGYVPQKLGLWPHLNVMENLELSAEISNSDVDLRSLLERFEVGSISSQRPETLSGGQYQRASLARAMATNSSVGILDEPLSALDSHLRTGHRRLIHNEVKQVFEYLFVVTHDVTEALYLADFLVIIAQGRVLQQGPVSEVIKRPASSAVAQILGADCHILVETSSVVSTEVANREVSFFSNDVTLSDLGSDPGGTNYCLGVFSVRSIHQLPWRAEVELENSAGTFVANLTQDYQMIAGKTHCEVRVPISRCFIF